MRRIGVRPDNDEIVVHHVAAIDAKTVGDELVLADPIVDQERIGVAARADRKRLAGADRDDVHAQAGRCAKDRQDVLEQAGILGRGGRAENDEALFGLGGRYDQGRQKQGENSNHFRFLAWIAGNVTPDQALVKSASRALLSFFSLRRRRATLIVLITDCERGMVEKA